MSLDASLTISRFELLAGTAEVKLDGETISGTFSNSPLVISNAARVCEHFANFPETASHILRFTKKYAPICEEAEAGKKFHFDIHEWRAWRTTFRNSWKCVAELASAHDYQEKVWSFPKKSRLIFSKHGNALQVGRFLDLMNLSFGGLAWERVRVCPAPGCEKAFFVATHLKQTYCGDAVCVEWGKRKLKLEYWNRNKERFLAERKLNR